MVTSVTKLVHAHVECRSNGTSWWRYAKVSLTPDARILDVLTHTYSDPDDDLVSHLGAPADLSVETRDEYTWRVIGDWARPGEERTIEPDEAERWLASGRSERWPTREPFERITDPIWEGATWLDSRELDRVIRVFEREWDDLIPATYCALLAMMDELERDYDVRVVLWFEPLESVVSGDAALDLRRRATSRRTSRHALEVTQ